MIKITVKQLRELNACEAGVIWFKAKRIRALRPLVKTLLADGHADYARWLLARLLTHPQQVKWAIFSAEQNIELFEKRYPGDNRPRKAIQAAKDFLAGRITAETAVEAARTARAAPWAARAAAWAAEAAGAAGAAWAAEAAGAAGAAAWAAAEAARAAAGAETDQKTSEYALGLLGE